MPVGEVEGWLSAGGTRTLHCHLDMTGTGSDDPLALWPTHNHHARFAFLETDEHTGQLGDLFCLWHAC